MIPKRIPGGFHSDIRGTLTFNNDFDATSIKRMYTIENADVHFIRGWQGHKVEQRWFACMKGSFEISVIEVDNFSNPSQEVVIKKHTLTDEVLTYLHVPAGCVTAIQSLVKESKLLVLSNFKLGKVNDEYRFPLDYFKNI